MNRNNLKGNDLCLIGNIILCKCGTRASYCVVFLNIISFSRPHNFCTFLYVIYILQHVSGVRGHYNVFYIHFLHQPHCFFAATPTLANVNINGGEGCCLPLMFIFTNDDLLK
jgi:hypothetical protein